MDHPSAMEVFERQLVHTVVFPQLKLAPYNAKDSNLSDPYYGFPLATVELSKPWVFAHN